MVKTTIAWSIMTLLALAISAYAAAVVLSPAFRPEFVQAILVQRPITAASHFLASAVALTLGAFQLNTFLRRRFLTAHRWLGRLYLVAVLLGGISGLVMATTSSGGRTAHLGFGGLAVAWLTTTFIAYCHILRRNIIGHQDWMIRSYALTLAAVTLRIYLPASQIAGMPFDSAYPIISWICWVPNLIVAEMFTNSRKTQLS
jgi:hypothetical protein